MTMKLEDISAGQTYHLELPNPSNPHLFVIILEIDPITGRTIIIPFDSENFDRCPTVEFEVGEHEFIKKRTYVSFTYATVIEASVIVDQVNSNHAKQMTDISPEKLELIIDRLPRSPATKDEVIDYFRTQTWPL